MAKGPKTTRVPGMRPLNTYEVARQEGDPILELPAREVTAWNREMMALGMKLRMHVIRDHQSLGLSGPQLGIPYRILAYKDERKNVHVLTNPFIESRSKETVVALEGCFSVRRGQVPVARSIMCVVKACDLRGVPVVVNAFGMVARVLQHEIDHLSGKMITAYGEPLGGIEMAVWEKEHDPLREATP